MLSAYDGKRFTPRGLPAGASANVGPSSGRRTSGGGWPAIATWSVEASGSTIAYRRVTIPPCSPSSTKPFIRSNTNSGRSASRA